MYICTEEWKPAAWDLLSRLYKKTMTDYYANINFQLNGNEPFILKDPKTLYRL